MCVMTLEGMEMSELCPNGLDFFIAMAIRAPVEELDVHGHSNHETEAFLLDGEDTRQKSPGSYLV